MGKQKKTVITDKMERNQAQRLMECAVLFADVLPIYTEEHRAAFRLAFKYDLTEIIPDMMKNLAMQCAKNNDATLSYIQFIRQSCEYIMGDRDILPDTEIDTAQLTEKISKQLNGMYPTKVPYTGEK